MHQTFSGQAHAVIQAGQVHGDLVVNVGAGRRGLGVGSALPPLPDHLVPRPELSERVVESLLAEHEMAVALVGVAGAGGFGKTTLAASVCRDRRVADRFSDGVLWVTVGANTHGPELAGVINDVSARVSGHRPVFTDPEQAGQHLGEVLAGGWFLVVVDDVWWASQLAPFLLGAPNCRRLVTTRVRSALPPDAMSVAVDSMTPSQAEALLGSGMDVSPGDVAPLLAATGGWPVLLQLANRAVRQYVRRGMPVADSVRRVVERLANRGPTAVDVTSADQRRLAVAATVEASLSQLAETNPAWLERFLELAVFGEDVAIPEQTLVTYWGATGGLDPDEVQQLCFELDELSLVQGYQLGPTPALGMHDVIGAYLRHRVGVQAREFQRALLDSFRGHSETGAAWWDLAEDDPYLRRHLAHHLRGADLTDELTAVATDFRWLETVLRLDGPTAAEADLAHVEGTLAAALRRAITQNAHLLRPIPGANGALGATLLSRLHGYPELADWVLDAPRPDLFPAWPMPDAPHPALHRALHHDGAVTGLAISPDGTWLATSSLGGAARLWNVDDSAGTTLAADDAAAHGGPIRGPGWKTWLGTGGVVTGAAIAPDGGWVAIGCANRAARLWNADGSLLATLIGHTELVTGLAISPDGTWLATRSFDGTVRLWDVDGRPRAVLVGHSGAVSQVVISPDGSWLATGGDDGTVRLWGADGSPRAVLVAHTELTIVGQTNQIRVVAISPDGDWIATACDDGTARIWNPDGTVRADLTGHYRSVLSLAISPDGTWLATGGFEGTARLWSPDGSLRGVLSGHERGVTDIAISPDGTWLATGSWDRTARIWEADGTPRATLTGHTGSVLSLAVSPDAKWLATGSDDGTVRMWDADAPADTPIGNPTSQLCVAFSPDGTRLATGGHDGIVVWDADGDPHVAITDFEGTVWDVEFGPDGAWLAACTLYGTACLWNTGSYSDPIVLRHDLALRNAAFSPDGDWLAIGDESGNVGLWNTDGSFRMTLPGRGEGVLGVAVSSDGGWLAIASRDGAVGLWSAEGDHLGTLTGHDGAAWSVAISPDRTWLASSGADGTVRVWNTDGSHRATLTGHSGTVWSVAISPDGTLLATAGDDGTVRLWNTASHDCVAALRTDSPLQQVAWHPNRSRIAVVGESGLYVFQLGT
ncbi:NB-ARC domain-containing protein [Saccharopolyspora taberi]